MIDRRTWLKGAAAVSAASLGTNLLNAAAQQTAPAQNADPAPVSEAWRTGTKIVLLGTQGGPLMNLNRVMTSQAVVVGGKIYLIDAGYGTLRRMTELGMKMDDLQQIFLTHHHSDHMMDLSAIMNVAWSSGVKREVGIYGPMPIEQTVRSAINMYAEDYRIRGAGGRFAPVEQVFRAHTLAKAGAVFEDKNVKVTSVQVPHDEFPLALGFRFEAADRIMAFSGDTGYSEHVVQLAKGADVLVHEAMYWPEVLDKLKAQNGGTAPQMQVDYYQESHTAAADAGRVAQAAGVKTLVLSHLIAGTRPLTDAQWIAAAKTTFSGKVVIARDRMIL